MGNYLIYAYEINKNVYVGLTKNLIQRDASHHTDNIKSDTLKKFCYENRYEIPFPRILENGLTAIEAQSKEKDWIEYYKDNGYTILNKAECGINKSSLGGITGERKEKEGKIKSRANIFEMYQHLNTEEIIKKMDEYTSKTEMCHKNHSFYEYCRLNGLLKYFPSKKSKTVKDKYEKEIHNIPLSIIDNAIEIPDYPTFFYLPETNCIYKKLKNKINQLIPQTRDSKIKYYYLYNREGKHNIPHHEIIRKIYFANYNSCLFLDNDLNNITFNNLFFHNFDEKNSKKITENGNYLINKDGLIYNKKNKYSFYGIKGENGYYFGKENVDIIISKLFLNYKEGKIIHLNNNIFDNHLNNLKIENTSKVFEVKFSNKSDMSSIKVSIINNGKKYKIGEFSDITLKEEITKSLQEKYYKNQNVDEWINDYLCNEFEVIKNKNKKCITDKIRVESCGCYWWKPNKCWKSKIYYNNKEYSLGYFDSFEKGKLLYEIASIMIKYNCFEQWYKKIEAYRETINKLL